MFVPLRCPPVIITLQYSPILYAASFASFTSLISNPDSFSASETFGVTRSVFSRRYFFKASAISIFASASPALATITGSTTMLKLYSSTFLLTSWMISFEYNKPVFEYLIVYSSKIESICSDMYEVLTGSTENTFLGFCAVSAVTAAHA